MYSYLSKKYMRQIVAAIIPKNNLVVSAKITQKRFQAMEPMKMKMTAKTGMKSRKNIMVGAVISVIPGLCHK
jgi:hypothetical protein